MILVPGTKIVVLPHIAKPVERKIHSSRSTDSDLCFTPPERTCSWAGRRQGSASLRGVFRMGFRAGCRFWGLRWRGHRSSRILRICTVSFFATMSLICILDLKARKQHSFQSRPDGFSQCFHVTFLRAVCLREGYAWVKQSEAVCGRIVVHQTDTGRSPAIGAESYEIASFQNSGRYGVEECFDRWKYASIISGRAEGQGVVSENVTQGCRDSRC